MRMRKRFTALVGFLMALSLFSTGFATTMTFYPMSNVSSSGKVQKPTIGADGSYTVGVGYFGIAWNKDGDAIKGTKISYDSVTSAGNTQYSFRNTTLSAQITVDKAVRESRKLAQYNSDCLVVQAKLTNETLEGWKGKNFNYSKAATVGLTDGTVFEKVAVTHEGQTLTMRIPIAMIYRLAAAQKGAPATTILAISLEFEDNGVSSDNVKVIGDDNITFKMATDYIS